MQASGFHWDAQHNIPEISTFVLSLRIHIQRRMQPLTQWSLLEFWNINDHLEDF